MEIEFVPLLHYIYLLEGKSYSGGSDSSEMWVDENENKYDVDCYSKHLTKQLLSVCFETTYLAEIENFLLKVLYKSKN